MAVLLRHPTAAATANRLFPVANAVEYLIEHPQTAESFGRAAAQKACHFENDIHMIRDLLYSP